MICDGYSFDGKLIMTLTMMAVDGVFCICIYMYMCEYVCIGDETLIDKVTIASVLFPSFKQPLSYEGTYTELYEL